MAKRTHIQRSFGGGEISPKLIMRGDTSQYQTSVLEMTNYMPTPQGSALRMPGTRYLYEAPATTARIIPYLTESNERTLVLLTDSSIRILTGIMDNLVEGQTLSGLPANGGTVQFRKRIIANGGFNQGTDPWVLTPGEYFGGKNGNDGPLGVFQYDNQTTLWLSPRLFKYNDETTVSAETTAPVNVATDVGTLEYFITYYQNPLAVHGGYDLTVTVSANSDYSSPLFKQTYTENTHDIGSVINIRENFNMPTAGWTGTLYIRMQATARASTYPGDSSQYSHPQFIARRMQIYANGETDFVRTDLVTPYLADELKDLHYIQSPYDAATGGKELVVTHPRHPPQKLYFNTNYIFGPITFSNTPIEWGVNNYPATCTSYHGRLILAGAQSFKTVSGDPLATVSETVWGTEVGKWDTFSGPTDVDPDDSIEFTSVYRSPIQWVYGGRSLLIGSLEFEYSASGEGIFSPGDLGVMLQSTHGSNNVQPAGFGEAVLFPSDGGTKVRSVSFDNNKQSWVATDLTVLHPSICYPRIVRMARCRNPYQMCLVLLESGDLAVFHSESGIEGWSRYRINNGTIQDVCVAPDNDGVDVPFMLVRRTINGVEKLYLECIPNFSETSEWSYLQSSVSFQFDAPTNVITGLDHLEGQIVLVKTAYRYVGFFKVTAGTVTLVDGNDDPINVIDCEVGLQHRSLLRTLPIPSTKPGAMKRFSSLFVRVLGSTRPLVNGERPDDREPRVSLNLSQSLDLLKDVRVTNLGSDRYLPIEISEHLPFRNEIIGIYGELEENQV